jgi:multidrug resistance protein
MRAKLWVLMVTAFVDMLGLVIVLPLLPFYATKLGANATIVGALIAAFSVAQLASAPVWGRFSDKYGRRPALLAGLLISAIAYLIFAVANSLWLLMLSRIIQGFGGGTIGVIQAYVADVSDPKDRAKGLGWLSAATSLGAVVGPAIGSVLVKFFGRNAPGIGAAVLCAAVSVFAWKYLGESRNAAGVEGHRPRSGASAIWQVLSNPRAPAARLIWIYAIAIGAFYGTVPTMPLILGKRLAVNEQTVGFIIMYLGGMGVIVRVWILGRMSDWLGEARLARVGLGFLAIGLGLVGAISSYFTMFVACTLMPIGTAFVFPAVTAALSRVVSAGERGLYMGVQHTFGGISRVAFPLAAGATMDRFGLGIPFYVAGALVAATLLLTMQMEGYTEPPVASVKASVAGGV